MNWISQHQNELSALSSVVIAFLTVVLIVITAIYVRANWKMMRLMEADVRLRTLPIIKFNLTLDNDHHTVSYALKPLNVPITLLYITIEFIGENGERETSKSNFVGKLLKPQEEFSIHGSKLNPAPYDYWCAQVTFNDLAERPQAAFFISDQRSDEEPATFEIRRYERLTYKVIDLMSKSRQKRSSQSYPQA